MEVREIKTKNLIIGALLGTLCMVILWLFGGLLRGNIDEKEIIIDKGLIIQVNDEIHEDVALSNFSFSLKRGDKVQITIPYRYAYDNQKTLMILLYLCGVETYVGDECIYSFGMDKIRDGLMVGSGYHIMNLPKNLNGNDIKIKIYVREDNAFTSIDEINCTDADAYHRLFARKSIVGLLTGAFLSGLGIILVIAGILATFFDKTYNRLPLIGIFALCMGLWSFSGQKTFQLFSDNFEVWTMLEYILLYTAPISLLMLIFLMRINQKDWKTWVLLADLVEYSLFVITCIVLHALNLVHLPQTLSLFHKQGAVVLVVAVVVGIFMVKNKNRGEIIFQLAIFILCGAIGIDMLRFNVQKYLLPNAVLLKTSILPVATVVFILVLVLSYIIHLYDMLMTKTEKEMLTQLAYHDNLTGLYNRAKANERFEELVANKEEYCIISLDANGLKYVNDNYGHEMGDKMLKSFALSLHDAFTGVGKCYRMGGDEFMAIVRKKAYGEIDSALKRVVRDLREFSEEEGIEFDTSYGLAYSKEIEKASPEKVYSLADDRMYKMKITKHNSRTAKEQT